MCRKTTENTALCYSIVCTKGWKSLNISVFIHMTLSPQVLHLSLKIYFVNISKSQRRIFTMSLQLAFISYLQSPGKQTPSVATHLRHSHNSTWLTRNDWFLNRDVIDPYPGCKWKPPLHRSWQPGLLLLGRWEETCEKWRPSVLMVPCPLYAVSDVNNSICQDMMNLELS